MPPADTFDSENSLRAEIAYLFRHALMRDAAYDLQLPADRSPLHDLALQLIEQLYGGVAPEPEALDADCPARFTPHQTDTVAHELAWHAQAVGPERHAQHRLYLRRAAEHAGRQCKAAEAAAIWRRLADLHEGFSRAECLRRAAVEELTIGRVSDAEPTLNAALALCREQGRTTPHGVEGITLSNMGVFCYQTGRFDEAEALLQQARAIHAAVGDKRREAISLGNLASLLQEFGRLEPAEAALTRSLSLFDEVGDTRYRAVAIGNLAILCQYSGREALAEKHFTEALQLSRQAGTPADIATVLGNFANLYRYTSRHELAEAAFREAIELLRAVGDLRMQGIVLNNYCLQLSELNRLAEAEDAAKRAIDLHRQTNNQRFIGPSMGNLATVFRRSGRPEAAVDTLRKAIEACFQAGDQDTLAEYQYDLAVQLVHLGRDDEARAAWQAAVDLYKVKDARLLQQKVIAMREACAKAGLPPFDEGEA